MSPLNRHRRALWSIAWILLGLVPSGTFFVWVERGCTLPWISRELGLPWIEGWDWPLPVQLLWNLGTIALFGLVHTLLAQGAVRDLLRRSPQPLGPLARTLLQPETERAFYVILTGICLGLIVLLWQGSGRTVWVVPGLKASQLTLASVTLFSGFLATSVYFMSRHGTSRFLGWSALATTEAPPQEASAPLISQGVYGRVRHPIYTFTLLAFFFTPLMTLDRLLLSVGMTVYLWLAIPIEERKLRAQFGADYDHYRTQVPALFPRLLSSSSQKRTSTPKDRETTP
jgi:protein-S-isoprenylcysteine O-methyltransferase Ste14